VRYLLHKLLGCKSVIAAGLVKNDAETILMLSRWADVVLICGEWELQQQWEETIKKVVEPTRSELAILDKMRYVALGPDIWANAFSLQLLTRAEALLKELLKGSTAAEDDNEDEEDTPLYIE
jgi:hypothetical protein